MKRLITTVILVLSGAGCDIRAPRVDSASASVPGYVVDSALSPEETLRRFRDGLDSVSRLSDDGPRSRRALIERFADAVAQRDTDALRRLSLSRAEFAYLYFPSTQYMYPPYHMPADVQWRLMHARSESGMHRLIARVGGNGFRVGGYECEPSPKLEGVNRLYQRCSVSYHPAGADSVETRRLFGSILERDGRIKFVSYANDF